MQKNTQRSDIEEKERGKRVGEGEEGRERKGKIRKGKIQSARAFIPLGNLKIS